MRIFIFKSQHRADLRAFAGEVDGRSLPSRLGPWDAIGVVRADSSPPHNLSREVIEKAIRTEGFQLWRMKAEATAQVD